MAPDYSGRWASLGRGESPVPDSFTPTHQHFRPLVDAADEFVHWAQTPDERVYLGFPEIDAQMRGIAPSEMCLINGYSHSGKTLFLLQILNTNKDKPVIYFCPDEPRQLTLIKLVSITHGVDANMLEQEVSAGKSTAIDLLKSTATKDYPNLAVFDQTLSLANMERALSEVKELWGQPALLVYDYLDLLTGGGETVPDKANTIKAFGKRHNIPLLVLHQSSRTSGADGKRQTISSGAYGGEQQATHIIGVRRKRFEIEAQIREIEEKLDRATNTERLLERLDTLKWTQRIHQDTLTVNLVKCKRPASVLLDDMDYEIEFGTGRLMRLQDGHSPSQFGQEASATVEPQTKLEMVNLEDW
jgi:KaiC/GvpD/RAD55 family RecA-like ATPase